jgi:hypothetical protein
MIGCCLRLTVAVPPLHRNILEAALSREVGKGKAMAITDVFDALTAQDRPYEVALSIK